MFSSYLIYIHHKLYIFERLINIKILFYMLIYNNLFVYLPCENVLKNTVFYIFSIYDLSSMFSISTNKIP